MFRNMQYCPYPDMCEGQIRTVKVKTLCIIYEIQARSVVQISKTWKNQIENIEKLKLPITHLTHYVLHPGKCARDKLLRRKPACIQAPVCGLHQCRARHACRFGFRCILDCARLLIIHASHFGFRWILDCARLLARKFGWIYPDPLATFSVRGRNTTEKLGQH